MLERRRAVELSESVDREVEEVPERHPVVARRLPVEDGEAAARLCNDVPRPEVVVLQDTWHRPDRLQDVGPDVPARDDFSCEPCDLSAAFGGGLEPYGFGPVRDV